MMRKISFADKLASQHEGMIHFHLYEESDLELSEKDFRIIVEQKLLEKHTK